MRIFNIDGVIIMLQHPGKKIENRNDFNDAIRLWEPLILPITLSLDSDGRLVTYYFLLESPKCTLDLAASGLSSDMNLGKLGLPTILLPPYSIQQSLWTLLGL
jgi:hypothetical protein